MDVETFFAAYVETALWSSSDESDESGGSPLDENYSAEDIAPETLESMRKDCEDFLAASAEDLEASGLSAGRAGHDFWLNRNGHGAGFWDEGLGDVGERLSKASKPYGSFDLYVGDDGQIHGQ